jgi:hyperosmotically inducible protein
MKMHSFNQYSHDLGVAVHDLWLTTKVKSALEMTRPTRGQHIHVKTHSGVVALSGQVESHRLCEQAIERARSVHGVSEVDAHDLEIFTVAPGHLPEAGDAEENMDYSAKRAMGKDDSRDRH